MSKHQTEECSGPGCPIEAAQKRAQAAAAEALANTGGACLDGSCDAPGPGTAALQKGNGKTGHCPSC